jgi:hypothetical protein
MDSFLTQKILRPSYISIDVYLEKVKQSLYRPIVSPEGSRRLRLPDIETIGT